MPTDRTHRLNDSWLVTALTQEAIHNWAKWMEGKGIELPDVEVMHRLRVEVADVFRNVDMEKITRDKVANLGMGA